MFQENCREPHQGPRAGHQAAHSPHPGGCSRKGLLLGGQGPPQAPVALLQHLRELLDLVVVLQVLLELHELA